MRMRTPAHERRDLESKTATILCPLGCAARSAQLPTTPPLARLRTCMSVCISALVSRAASYRGEHFCFERWLLAHNMVGASNVGKPDRVAKHCNTTTNAGAMLLAPARQEETKVRECIDRKGERAEQVGHSHGYRVSGAWETHGIRIPQKMLQCTPTFSHRHRQARLCRSPLTKTRCPVRCRWAFAQHLPEESRTCRNPQHGEA